MKLFDEIPMKQEALFYMNKIEIQHVELFVLKIYRNNKYLP